MRTANPALNDKVFRDAAITSSNVMTVQGAVSRTAILLAILLGATTFTWNSPDSGGLMLLGAIAGFIVALITIFNPKISPVCAPIYAACEGLLLGGISRLFELQYPGIVLQAIFLTFGTLGALLLVYSLRIVRATEQFKMGVFAATGGIALFYLFAWIFSFFGGGHFFSVIYSNGLAGIIFSVIVVVIAALNLVLDFDFIERGAAQGAPRYMEWYAAFGLMVTLVWLYIEILRLLSKLSSRR
ncbi:MAG: Bax inhibitor-1/YccA family protein [Kiritimatiellales bacterium]